MDESIKRMTDVLVRSNPASMKHMKEMMWEGTSHWDTLLHERGKISGNLVLSDFCKQAIARFKANVRQKA
jgi:methylglutaconyl-CoA hydratase